MFFFTSQLSRTLGVRGSIMLFVNYYVTARILRAVTPAFGRLAAVEARLEGEYRAGMGRVGRESEEVALVCIILGTRSALTCLQVLQRRRTRTGDIMAGISPSNQAY